MFVLVRVSGVLPQEIELASTGSVGVTQAPMTRLSRNVRPGMRPHTRRLVMNQAVVIIGPSNVARLFHSRAQYFAGKEMPVKRTWMPMTTRVIS